MLNMKKDFNINLKHFPIIHGSLGDFLVQCYCEAILKRMCDKMHPLSLVGVLKNVAPLLKNLNRESC